LPLLAYTDSMERDPCRLAETILAGTAEVESGYIHTTAAGDDGKESVIHIVEVLHEVREILPASYDILTQDRH